MVDKVPVLMGGSEELSEVLFMIRLNFHKLGQVVH